MEGVKVGSVNGGELRISEEEQVQFYITMRKGKWNVSIHEESRKGKRRGR